MRQHISDDSETTADSEASPTLKPPPYLQQRLAWETMDPAEFQGALGGLVQDLSVKVHAIDAYARADHESLIALGKQIVGWEHYLGELDNKLNVLWSELNQHRKDEVKLLQALQKLDALEKELRTLKHSVTDHSERIAEGENDTAIVRSQVSALETKISSARQELQGKLVDLSKRVADAPIRMPSQSEIKLQNIAVGHAENKLEEETTKIRQMRLAVERRERLWKEVFRWARLLGRWLFLGGGAAVIIGGAITLVKGCGNG